jgi:YHS domain-containing protein
VKEMKVKRKHLVTVWLFVGVLLVGMIAMQGCETSEPGGSGALAEARREIDEQRHKAMVMSEPKKELVQTAEQTACPIMGMAIDKNVYTEYKGKKVYFCCAGCETPFLENPEKYLSKLPQFNNQ